MKLIWHVVRKDLRRLAWPAAGWLAFQVAAALGVASASWSPETVDATGAADWMRTLRTVVMLAGWVELSVAVLLAGVLVLEDHAVGSDVFWRTRPIGARRLLGAKLLSAALVLVVAPVAVLVPVWLGAGFSGGELGRAALSTLAVNAWVALMAMGVAGLTANLGQHAFAVLVLSSLALLAVIVLPELVLSEGTKVEALEAQAWLIGALVILAAVAALWWQYFIRRTAVGWGIWVAAFAGIAAVRLGWTWDMTGAGRWRAPSSAEQGVPLTLEGAAKSSEFGRGSPLRVAMRAGGGDGEFMAPVAGSGNVRGGERSWATVDFSRGEGWGRDAVRRLAGVASDPGRITWELMVQQRHEWADGGPAAALRFSGQLEFARWRGGVLYELPVRPGATAQRGGERTRLVGHLEGSLGVLVVEERGVPIPGVGVVSRLQRAELFLLVHRASGAVRDVKAVGQLGAALHSLNRNMLTLTPEPAGDLGVDGWTLVKVRLEPVEWWMRDLADAPVHPMAGAREGGS